MNLYATIDLVEGAVSLAEKMKTSPGRDEASFALASMKISTSTAEVAGKAGIAEPMRTYNFDPEDGTWKAIQKNSSKSYEEEVMPRTFSVSSYNVLAKQNSHDQDRHGILGRNLLSESATADVLVLQEVCDDFLSYLLSNAEVQRQYPFATHGPPCQEGMGPLPSLRNIVVLSKWDFTWNWMPLETRHKGHLFLTVDGVGKYDESDNFIPLVIAAVHLSSGLTDTAVATKKSQLQQLLAYLSEKYSQNPCIIAGDFNITTSMYSIDKALNQTRIRPQTYETQLELEVLLSEARLSDVWHIARTGMGGAVEISRELSNADGLYEGEQGATFDPASNPLAMESSRTGYARPQRYDRILTREQGFLQVSKFNMFGFPEERGEDAISGDDHVEPEFGSDHWGIRATFQIRGDDGLDDGRMDTAVEISTSLQFHKAPQALASIESLKAWLAECGVVPSQDEVRKRKSVLEVVRNTILYGSPAGFDEMATTSSQRMVSLVMVPVGSYGLGVWNSSSDVDCLCIGSVSSKTFFLTAIQRLSKAASSGIRILRKIKAASGTMLEIDVDGVKFDIHYCPALRIVERWSEVSQLPASDPLFDMPLASLTKLQPFLDLNSIQRTVPDLAAFRTVYRFIKTWAKQRGIYAAKFGYLGGIHITMMLSRLLKLLLFRGVGAATPADLICTFFKHYAAFDWEREILYDPFFFKGEKPRYRRYVNESMVILTLHPPVINVARAVSVPSKGTIVEELKRAAGLISHPDVTWSALSSESLQQEEATGADDFLKFYSSYIKINVRYWGLSLSKGSSLVGWLESRCLRLLIDLDKRLPSIRTRIWPARFTAKDADVPSSSGEGEYQGCYLIGLAKHDTDGVDPMTKEERKRAYESLQAVLDRFTAQVQAEEKYFDPNLAWIDATHVKQSDLIDLTIDLREWGNYVLPEEADSDSEADEQEDDEDLVDPEAEEALASNAALGVARTAKQKSGKGRQSQINQAAKKMPKLRPASDILNRLRWDPALDSGEYIIGYEDRFLGAKEMALENWKAEQTDEEFIPLHRILYFKRRTDGEIVWDRRSRKDQIFGSGAGSGSR